jgi:hypothetical protein
MEKDCLGRPYRSADGRNKPIVNKWVFYYPPAQALRYDPFLCFINGSDWRMGLLSDRASIPAETRYALP